MVYTTTAPLHVTGHSEQWLPSDSHNYTCHTLHCYLSMYWPRGNQLLPGHNQADIRSTNNNTVMCFNLKILTGWSQGKILLIWCTFRISEMS